MASSVNKVILIGNLGKDPEIRKMNSGESIAVLKIATSESWKDKTTGERKEKTEWHNIVVYNENLAKICEQYLKKGAKIYLEGQLQTRKYTDNTGQEKYITEIVLQRYRGEITLLDRMSKGDDYSGGYSELSHSGKRELQNTDYSNLDDDIPF